MENATNSLWENVRYIYNFRCIGPSRAQRNAFHKFLAKQSSLAALAMLSIFSVVFAFLYSVVVAVRQTIFSVTFGTRFLRFLALLPMLRITYNQYSLSSIGRGRRARKQETNAAAAATTTTSDMADEDPDLNKKDQLVQNTAWWSNQCMLWLSISGGVILIHRALVGECDDDQSRLVCNPQADDKFVPFDTLLTMAIGTISVPIIFKAHDAIYAYFSMAITILAILIAFIIVGGYYDLALMSAYLFAMTFCLYDYEQSILNFFISSRNAEIYYANSLQQAKENQSTQLANEQMVYLMGNISHDLKTPLQSFMSEVDALKALLAEQRVLCREFDKIITSVSNNNNNNNNNRTDLPATLSASATSVSVAATLTSTLAAAPPPPPSNAHDSASVIAGREETDADGSIVIETVDTTNQLELVNLKSKILKCEEEIDLTILSLENVYSFMMLAINRGEDFSKSRAGVKLEARNGSFDIDEACSWSVSRMTGGPTNVQLLIERPVNRWPVNEDSTEDLLIRESNPSEITIMLPCNFIISDRHWFCENLLTLLSNAMKFTVQGSVVVAYRLVALKNTQRAAEGHVEEKATEEEEEDESEAGDAAPSTSSSSLLLLPVVVQDGRTMKDLFTYIVDENDDINNNDDKKNSDDDVHTEDIELGRLVDSDAQQYSNRFLPGPFRKVRAGKQPKPTRRYLLVSVSDTGIGIEAAKQGSLFKAFEQSQYGTGGTGLGLFSLAMRMKALGGHCGVQDREDGAPGLTIWLAYPYTPDYESGTAAQEAEAEAASVAASHVHDNEEEEEDSQARLEMNGYDANDAISTTTTTATSTTVGGSAPVTPATPARSQVTPRSGGRRSEARGMAGSGSSRLTVVAALHKALQVRVHQQHDKHGAQHLDEATQSLRLHEGGGAELRNGTSTTAAPPMTPTTTTTTIATAAAAGAAAGAGAVAGAVGVLRPPPLLLSQPQQYHVLEDNHHHHHDHHNYHPLELPYPLESTFWQRVLLVEDAPLILKTLTRLLHNEGFTRVDIAQNGFAGLELMKTTEYLMVLTDIQMPVLDGLEMVKRLRSFEQQQQQQQQFVTQPLLATTGDIERGDLERTTVTGAGAEGEEAAVGDNSLPTTAVRRHRQLIFGMSANCTEAIREQAVLAGMDNFLPKPVLQSVLREHILRAYSVYE